MPDAIKLTSFAADIRPLFTERDVNAMSKAFNLASYEEMKAHAAAVYNRIRGIGGAVMPPPPPRGEGPGRDVALICSAAGWRTTARRRARKWITPAHHTTQQAR
jgi:hypothetical protein